MRFADAGMASGAALHDRAETEKIRTRGHSKFQLVNVHLASSGRDVEYRAVYGRGVLLGRRKHHLGNGTREAVVDKWLSHAHGPTVVAGDFNIDDMSACLRGTASPQTGTL